MPASAADAPAPSKQPQVLLKQPTNIEEEYTNLPIRSVLGDSPSQPLSNGKMLVQSGEFEIANEGRGDATGDLAYSTPLFSEYHTGSKSSRPGQLWQGAAAVPCGTVTVESNYWSCMTETSAAGMSKVCKHPCTSLDSGQNSDFAYSQALSAHHSMLTTIVALLCVLWCVPLLAAASYLAVVNAVSGTTPEGDGLVADGPYGMWSLDAEQVGATSRTA